ncbi:MAG: DUF6600 domain-containing protein [Gemmatimonadales bacterium]
MRRVPWMTGSFLSVLAGAVLAQQPTPAAAGDPPARVARVSYILGTVSLQPSGDTGWSLATVNYPMTTGDRIYTDNGARSELQIGLVAARVAEGTDLTVTNLTDQLVQLGLTQGMLEVSIYRLDPGDSVEVDTPRGALALLAPGNYRIDNPPGDEATVVAVGHGSLQWTAGGVAQVVQEGQAIRVTGINPIQVASIPLPSSDAFDQWSAGRDRSISASPSAQYVSRDVPGYEDLDANGSWSVEADYGPVWYPTAVPAGWVPYRIGHWVWIEPWGWTWVEHESWGYAPFHYGRWVNVGARWGWIPGPVNVRPYYAPALVVFLGGSSFQVGVQAWFPLGPSEPYYPWYHHDDEYRRRINVTNIPNFRDVAHVNDVTYINRIQYRNRAVATTAVATAAFQNGQPVGRRVIPVDRNALGRAAILPHPIALPARTAASGGVPSPGVPRTRRPEWVNAPVPRPATPLSRNQPLVVQRNAPAPGRTPTLITRRAPPPQQPAFHVRQQAMQPDAGRPLEPQQIQNLQSGKPAGPRRDREYPPHAVAAPPPQRPAPAAQPAPRARPAPTPRAKLTREPAKRPKP